MPKRSDRGRNNGILSQHWMTFGCNPAKAIITRNFRTVVREIFRPPRYFRVGGALPAGLEYRHD